MNKRRAGCVETCTSGSEGGPQKPTASKDRQGTAVRPLHERRLMHRLGCIPLFGGIQGDHVGVAFRR
jgi:hypothetical protein